MKKSVVFHIQSLPLWLSFVWFGCQSASGVEDSTTAGSDGETTGAEGTSDDAPDGSGGSTSEPEAVDDDASEPSGRAGETSAPVEDPDLTVDAPTPDAGQGGAGDGPVEAAGAGGVSTDLPATGGSPSDVPDAMGGSSGGGAAPTLEPSECNFTIDASLSDPIPTVGIVEFSTDFEGVSSARIDFGLDETYGMSAPVDLAEPNYRTVLLGMKASEEYHFRVVVEGQTFCASEDQVLATGVLPSSLPGPPTITTDAANTGFLVSGFFTAGGAGGRAFIVDMEGDYVWFWLESDVSRARMSHDGKYMWIASSNLLAGQGEANVVRVSMDGSERTDFSATFEDQHHDFAVLPDESIVFPAYSGDCDEIREAAPDGTVRTIVDVGQLLGVEECETNAIQYSRDDDTIVFGERDSGSYVKVTLQGEAVWILGGELSNFSGDGASWSSQQGFHVLGAERLLFFDNSSESGSSVVEIALDPGAATASRIWEHTRADPIFNQALGDVQRLADGDTLISYSTQGVFEVLDPEGNQVLNAIWQAGTAIGYAMKRESLYGPPPK